MSALVDAFGRPFTAAAQTTSFRTARRLLESEVAISKLLSFLGSVPDPDELLKKAGIKRHQLQTLELDDEVAQCIDTRVEAVISTPWRVEPQNQRVSKWLRAMIEPHVEDLLRASMDARFYGYSVVEVIYKRTDKGIGIDRLSQKPMQWFAPQQDGTLRYFPDDGTGGTEGIEVSPLKFLLTRCNATYQNPYGKALLSPIYFPVTWRREGWGMWLQFLETFGEPIVLGQVTNYEDFVNAMNAQGVRSTIAWKSVTESDKVDTINASTPGEFERLEKAIIRRIQKLILGQTMTSDVGTSGSYAVAAIHNEVRNDKRRSDIRMTSRSGQALVNMLCAVNRWPAPKFLQADDSGLELARAQRDNLLSGVLLSSGFKLSEGYFLDRYDLRANDLIPADAEEDDIVDSEDEATGRIDDGRIGQDDSVSDRSVTDSDMSANRRFGERAIFPREFAARDRSVVHLTNEIHLPEGKVVPSEPISINMNQDAQPIHVTVTMPEQAATNVTVNVPEQAAPVVNFTAPEHNSEIVVNVPEPAAPIVNFVAPDPVVNVNVEAPNVSVTPEISVKLGTRKTETTVERDQHGNIVSSTQIETDLEGEQTK
jgi:hypothetical protein